MGAREGACAWAARLVAAGRHAEALTRALTARRCARAPRSPHPIPTPTPSPGRKSRDVTAEEAVEVAALRVQVAAALVVGHLPTTLQAQRALAAAMERHAAARKKRAAARQEA